MLGWPPTFAVTAELRCARAATCAGNARPVARMSCNPRETCCSRQVVPISHKGEHLAVQHFPMAADPRRLSFRYVSSCKVSCLVQPCSVGGCTFQLSFLQESAGGGVCSLAAVCSGRSLADAAAQPRPPFLPDFSSADAAPCRLAALCPTPHSWKQFGQRVHSRICNLAASFCVAASNQPVLNRASLHSHIHTLSRLPP